MLATRKTHGGVLTTVLNILVFKNANDVDSDMKINGNVQQTTPDDCWELLKSSNDVAIKM